MSQILNAENSSLDGLVLEDNIVLVDFWAPWCGPCRMVAPVLDEVAAESKDKFTIVKVNVDENQDLAVKHGIRSIPAFLYFKNGEVVDQDSGPQSKDHFLAKLNTLV